MDNHRRKIVLGASAAAGITWLPRTADAAHGGVHATPLRTRVNVGSLAATSPVLESFRRAIEAMKRLPETNARSWTAFARVHDRFCSHNNWYILPWHRAYLTAFELVCRRLSGDDNFRVPYWDWTSNRQIPPVFSAATHAGRANALFLPTRTSPPFPDPMNPATPYRTRPVNDAMPDFAVGATVIETALREPNFERFAGSRPRRGSTPQNSLDPVWQRRSGTAGPLESNPHNFVHGWVGGTMSAFLSPLDPLFWCHHANLDRLWWRWVRPGFANSTDPLWLNFRFSGQFVDGAATPWNPRVRDLVNVNALGYTYPAAAATRSFPFAPAPLDARLLAPLPALARGMAFRPAELAADAIVNANQVLTVALAIGQSPGEVTARLLGSAGGAAPRGATAANAPVARGRVIVNVEAEIATGPTPHVRVFLSCPYLSPETPASDPHFVGSFAFFAAEHAEGAHAGHGAADAPRMISVSLDLTRTLAALRETGRMPERFELQMLPVPLAGAEAPPVRVRRVEFASS